MQCNVMYLKSSAGQRTVAAVAGAEVNTNKLDYQNQDCLPLLETQCWV